MRPNQSPPLPSGPTTTEKERGGRRRPDLTLPLPQRDPYLAVPIPLPPSSATSSSSSSSSIHNHHHQSNNNNNNNNNRIVFKELERVNRIGSGSGGTVYKVIHRLTGRIFALKVIYGNHEESVRRQICREIEILRGVDNPNVVRCHEMYDRNGEIAVLLEFMDGGSLEGTHIPNEQQLSDLARQMLRGLAYLHGQKIVHRDIKPSNLLINARNQVKIADFGVSRILAQTMDPCNSSVGTIAYMSPERVNTDLNQGQYVGYAGDIWSLGVSILEFYLGRFPFEVGRKGDWASLMCAICMSQPPEAPATASREFRSFIACCLQRDPRRRWTAATLLLHPFISQYNGGQNQPDNLEDDKDDTMNTKEKVFEDDFDATENTQEEVFQYVQDVNLEDVESIAWSDDTDDITNIKEEVFDRLQPLTDVQDDFDAVENTQAEVFQDVQDANLKNNQSIAWRVVTNDIKNIQEEVFDRLQPLTELQKLQILFWVQQKLHIQLYEAKIFPNWRGHGSFSRLVKVDLVYCKSCYCLPSLGQLPFLKKLHIEGFDRVERIGDEFYSTDSLSSSKPFKSLESLTFSHMSRWKEWSLMKNGVFSDLKQLTLENCRRLKWTCFPSYLPSLQSLLISECKKQLVASLSTDGLPLLSFFKIGHCTELESFPISALPANVDTVKIMGCKELVSLSEDGWPSNLKSLEISYCGKLFGNSLWWNLRTLTSLTSLQIIKIDEVVDSFPEEWQLPTTLKSLTLRHFRNLKSLNGKALQHHTSLKELKIEFCHHLHYLPEEGLPDSLSQLEIFGCGFLNGRCQKERGEDWPKISHIPHILIDCKEI